MASNAENISIWWRHHVLKYISQDPIYHFESYHLVWSVIYGLTLIPAWISISTCPVEVGWHYLSIHRLLIHKSFHPTLYNGCVPFMLRLKLIHIKSGPWSPSDCGSAIPFSWCKSIYDEWVMTKWLARWPLLWVAKAVSWDSEPWIRNYVPTHEAVRSWLAFTLLPVHRDFMYLLNKILSYLIYLILSDRLWIRRRSLLVSWSPTPSMLW